MPRVAIEIGSTSFCFKDCSVISGCKSILHQVSGEVSAGQVLSIMGPSGAGKTTLLNVLTLTQQSACKVTGAVSLNGHPFCAQLFRKYAAFVPQEDFLPPYLTCRQCLQFAAELYLPPKSRETAITKLLEQLGLKRCEDTLVGGGTFRVKGLSGGEKRRLSLATALIKNPTIVFLDEPTSGLDSAAADGIMEFLEGWARKEQRIVICTIHQPSSTIFKSFSSTLLLVKGQVAYCGSPSAAVTWMQRYADAPFDSSCSHAEYVLSVLNSDFGGNEGDEGEGTLRNAERVLAAWETLGAGIHRILDDGQVGLVPELQSPCALPDATLAQPWLLWHICVHAKWHTYLSLRDPTLYVIRVFLLSLSSMVFAFVYWDARSRVQEQVVNRLFLCVWYVSVPTSMSVVAVYSMSQNLLYVTRNIKDGMYSPLAFALSNTLVQAPWMLIMSLVTLGIGAYGMANFQAAGFARMLLAHTVVMWTFEMFAQLLAAVSRNPFLGMGICLVSWFVFFLVSGLFISDSSIHWPIRAFMYASPFRWILPAIVYTEFHGSVFETEDQQLPDAIASADSAALQYGATGDQVLDSIRLVFTIFSSADTFAQDVAYTAAIGGGSYLLFLIVLHVRTLTAATPKNLTPSSSRPHYNV